MAAPRWESIRTGSRIALVDAILGAVLGGALPGPVMAENGAAPDRAVHAVCSPKEPFSPPLLATVARSGQLILDQRKGLAMVVSSQAAARPAAVTITVFNAAT